MSNGYYSVEINSNSCIDTSECMSVLSVGLERNPVTGLNFSFYPNPVSGVLKVKSNSSSTNSHTLRLFDLKGRLVLNSIIEKKMEIIELEHLENGVYFLEFNGQF